MIEHKEDEQSFFIDIDGQQAYMRYRLSEDKDSAENKEVDFYTTFVPDSLRGQGVAAQLVAAGFEWADQQELEIKSSCWYAAKKLERRQAGQQT